MRHANAASVLVICALAISYAQTLSWPSTEPVLRASGDATTVELTGRVTASDKGTYQEHVFEVPARVT